MLDIAAGAGATLAVGALAFTWVATANADEVNQPPPAVTHTTEVLPSAPPAEAVVPAAAPAAEPVAPVVAPDAESGQITQEAPVSEPAPVPAPDPQPAAEPGSDFEYLHPGETPSGERPPHPPADQG